MSPARKTANPDHDELRGQATFRLVLLILAVCLALAGARVFGLSLPPRKKIPFDPSRLFKIAIEKPHYVFIGNSHLGTRLNLRMIKRAIAPKRASVITRPGTHVSHWYLQFKNDVIAANVAPERVIFFIRGQLLTQPNNRGRTIWGEYEEYSLDYEPILRKVLSGKPTTLSADFASWASHIVPISRFRRTATGALKSIGLQMSNLAVSLPRAEGTATPASNRIAEINSLFNVDELREFAAEDDDPTAVAPDTSEDFDTSVERSFLPEFMRLAETNDIDIFFLRLKERKHIDFPEKEPEALAYSSKLEAYLEANGAGYRDLSVETWIQRSWFRDNVHIKRDMRDRYSRAFLNKVPEVFK